MVKSFVIVFLNESVPQYVYFSMKSPYRWQGVTFNSCSLFLHKFFPRGLPSSRCPPLCLATQGGTCCWCARCVRRDWRHPAPCRVPISFANPALRRMLPDSRKTESFRTSRFRVPCAGSRSLSWRKSSLQPPCLKGQSDIPHLRTFRIYREEIRG